MDEFLVAGPIAWVRLVVLVKAAGRLVVGKNNKPPGLEGGGCGRARSW